MAVGLAALLVWLQTAGVPECRPDQLAVLVSARELMTRGAAPAARRALVALPAEGLCPRVHLARWAAEAWFEARALAAFGGAAERLGPVRAALDLLARLSPDTSPPAPATAPDGLVALHAEYAQVLARAAIAAAQDERPEMELLLDHARDLVQRLAARGERAVWPLPFNLAAGELWFEVDRYEEARAAFERAVLAEASPAALVGMARTLSRLGRVAEACDSFRRARQAAPELRAAATGDLSRCR